LLFLCVRSGSIKNALFPTAVWYVSAEVTLRPRACVCLCVWNSYKKNELDALISQIYFWNKTLHVSDSSSVHHQRFSLYTQHWYLSYRFADSLHENCMTYMLCAQWRTPDDGQRNSPKPVEFYSKNKFEKLVHPVGFIIRIYHDARSLERQMYVKCYELIVLLGDFELSL